MEKGHGVKREGQQGSKFIEKPNNQITCMEKGHGVEREGGEGIKIYRITE